VVVSLPLNSFSCSTNQCLAFCRTAAAGGIREPVNKVGGDLVGRDLVGGDLVGVTCYRVAGGGTSFGV